MAEFTLTIPDNEVTLVITSLCQAAGYTDTADFTAANGKAFLIHWIENVVSNQQAAPPPAPPTQVSLGMS